MIDKLIKNNEKYNKIIFWLSLLSPVIGIVFMLVYVSLNKINQYVWPAFTWCFLFALPIPIISIFLGIIFKKHNVKFKNLLYCGFVTFMILFIVGIVPFEKKMHLNYEEAEKYLSIFKVEMPKTGNYYHIEYVDEQVNPYTDFIIFNEKDSRKLLDSINESDYWILKEEINEDILNFFPWSLDGSSTRLYLVYNITAKEYNVYLEGKSKQEVYIVTFDMLTNTLIIEYLNI